METRRRRAGLAAAAAAAALAVAIASRACSNVAGTARDGAGRASAAADRSAESDRGAAGAATAAARGDVTEGATATSPGAATWSGADAGWAARSASEAPGLGEPPSTGWEEAAEVVTADLRRILDGRPRAGAYAEARSEAARADLALFPPDRDRVRRLLAGSERERTLALAALAARADPDDDLLRVVLRAQRPEDDEVVRLLGAELAAAAPAHLAARYEDDLLRAFEREPNPLVLAVALPALERMGEGRLRALLRAQVSSASPEMLPVLLALARDRLGAAAFEDVREALAVAVGTGE